jgi:hypothetical protein
MASSSYTRFNSSVTWFCCFVMSSFALLFVILALAMPRWTLLTKVGAPNDDPIKAGLFSFCRPSVLYIKEFQLPECHFYFQNQFVSSSQSLFSLCTVDNNPKRDFYVNFAVGYGDDQELNQRSENQRDAMVQFIEATCSGKGQATLAFVSLTLVFNVFHLVVFAWFLWLRNKSSALKLSLRLLTIASWLPLGVCVLAVTSFALWISQASALTQEETGKLGVSFFLMVLVAVCHFFVFGLSLWRLPKYKSEHEAEKQDEGNHQESYATVF